LYIFLKDSLIRKYGDAWYKELVEAVEKEQGNHCGDKETRRVSDKTLRGQKETRRRGDGEIER